MADVLPGPREDAFALERRQHGIRIGRPRKRLGHALSVRGDLRLARAGGTAPDENRDSAVAVDAPRAVLAQQRALCQRFLEQIDEHDRATAGSPRLTNGWGSCRPRAARTSSNRGGTKTIDASENQTMFRSAIMPATRRTRKQSRSNSGTVFQRRASSASPPNAST